jgi:Mn2+/Fe2+ NRAMP family transporter
VFIALVPIPALLFGFESILKYYAVFGACFIPFLAGALLFLNGSARRIGERHRNRLPTNILLAVTVLLFLLSLYFVVRGKFG